MVDGWRTVSDESGTERGLRRPLTSAGSRAGAAKWQLSTGGRSHPIWSRNAREIFTRARTTGSWFRTTPSAGPPSRRASHAFGRANGCLTAGYTNLDLAPDGKRFVVAPAPDVSSDKTQVAVFLNFFDELRRRIRSRKVGIVGLHRLSVLLLLCSSSCGGTPTMPSLVGEWGGDHVSLAVSDQASHAELDCAHGNFSAPAGGQVRCRRARS